MKEVLIVFTFPETHLKIATDNIHTSLQDISHKRNTHRIRFFLKLFQKSLSKIHTSLQDISHKRRPNRIPFFLKLPRKYFQTIFTHFASGNITRKTSLSHARLPEILSNIPPERYRQKKYLSHSLLPETLSKIPLDDTHRFRT